MNAEQTKEAIRNAMRVYETKVLDPRFWDAEHEIYRYPYRVSAAEVLKLAGVKSRSTLVADYHADIKVELATFIERLKRETGKGRSAPAVRQSVAEKASRLEQLAQTIAAQDYKIRALEQELADLRSRASRTVTNLRDRRM